MAKPKAGKLIGSIVKLAKKLRVSLSLELIICLFLSSLLSACVSSPSKQFLYKAQQLGFSESSIETPQFDLKAYYNSSFKPQQNQKLNLYLEGDGQPFFQGQYINADPTSRKGLMLELMSLDQAPAILIGRPCYHQAGIARNCDNKWWTSHRYNEAVVSSMVSAIRQFTAQTNSRLTLIGFSGGGALAMLIATELNNVDKIITINANLDTDKWVQQHNYTPLTGSLNPIKVLDSLATIPQYHLVGANDTQVDASVWLDKVQSYKHSEVRFFQSFSHQCCWADVWSEIINK